MESSKGRRWLIGFVTVLMVAGATMWIAAGTGLADACNSPDRVADLSLTGSAAPAGSNFNYRFVVTNNGPDCTAGVTLTVDLAPGSTFLGVVSSDRSWVCSGTNTVTCSLQSTLPSPPGNNVTAITLAATAPSSPSNATVRGEVSSTDPLTDSDLTNNVVWTVFGKTLNTADPSGNHPGATIVRPDARSISANLYDILNFGDAPAGYSFLTDRAILVNTPAASGGSKKGAITLLISFVAQVKPGAFVFHLDDATNTWSVVNQKCGGNGPFPCVDGVSFNSGIATITVLTLHFSHYGR
jgi:Domain of unknown function DUF11